MRFSSPGHSILPTPYDSDSGTDGLVLGGFMFSWYFLPSCPTFWKWLSIALCCHDDVTNYTPRGVVDRGDNCIHADNIDNQSGGNDFLVDLETHPDLNPIGATVGAENQGQNPPYPGTTVWGRWQEFQPARKKDNNVIGGWSGCWPPVVCLYSCQLSPSIARSLITQYGRKGGGSSG